MCSDVCFVNERNIHSHRPESEGDFSLDSRITFMLSEEPFLSVDQTAGKAMMLKSIVYRHLTQTMRWKLRHLKWVPHSVMESEKMNRVQRATKLLEHLQSIRHQESQCILTLDESLFYSEIDWEQQSLPEDDEQGTRTKRGNGHSNMMLMIAWNSNGFHLIDAMPKGEKHSARYHINNITTPICQRLIPAGERKLVIQPDNSLCHTAKVVLDFVSQKDRFALHPRYSPDITPSDFLLFGHFKHELRGPLFQTGEELLVEIRKLVGEIPPETLLDVFVTGFHGAKV
jgi:hypothetical protein